MTPTPDSAPNERDWPEGRDYTGICWECHERFVGPKFRIMARQCRQCAEAFAISPDSAPAAQTPSDRIKHVSIESGSDARIYSTTYAAPLKIIVGDETVYDTEGLTAAQSRIAELEQQIQMMLNHDAENLESDSMAASCNCLTKTPEIKYHKRGCKYRLISERNEARQQLAAARADGERLDWLERVAHSIHGAGLFAWNWANQITIRSAIDAARNPKEQP